MPAVVNGNGTVKANGSNGITNGTNGTNGHARHHWPENVGILDVEMYFPSEYVDQTELEEFDGVSKGKYTAGLGQTRMAISSDREDIYSFCLTVTKRLLEKSGVSSADIGFLAVGSETLLDKSKSIKSVLMQLFPDNHRIKGIDNINACYGGTAALLQAVDWVESRSWDGRLAIVVCGDIAIYAEGPARPTCGAGAVAMLIGPGAPLVIESTAQTHYMDHVYDFYKPVLDSEYPIVDGQLSIVCYLEAAMACFRDFKQRYSALSGAEKRRVLLEHFDGLIFHAPYCKLVQKTLARLALEEFQSDPAPDFESKYKGAEKYKNYSIEDSLKDREFEPTFLRIAGDVFAKAVKPNLLLATEIGNMYTASMYGCLVSYLITKDLKDIAGKSLLFFSYGSGLASSMFSVRISDNAGQGSPLEKIHHGLRSVSDRLQNRIKVAPDSFAVRMKERERLYNTAPYAPGDDLANLFPGTYHLIKVDEMRRRTYERTPITDKAN